MRSVETLKLYMTDPIADMLTRIRNAYQAHHGSVVIPHSKMKHQIAKLLEEAGFIAEVKQEKSGKKITRLKLSLKYIDQEPALSHLKRISKPGRRVYTKATKLPKVLGGYGNTIISTSQGLMLDKKARELKLGGEVICQMW